MGEPIHKTCVRVNSADDEEARDEVDHDLPKKNPFVRGSDPRVATCRGRLQTRRCQLNQEINKELRLRAGAENLFKATTNRKLRETVALELSFVNSNLQLLKEQLAELNSSMELYQSDSKECVMPMIPLGLKETKEVDFREPFKDFILEHYSEDAAAYEDAISDFMDMRQAMRTPVRSAAGVSLLFKYYNQLYYIERRFFPPDRSLGVYFEWFDSLTGVPSCQRTVAFEKACVLFNMAGIYTQIGAKQERHTCAGLDGAVDALLRAAGTLRYIHENFTNAPSVDLAADTLLVLGALMTAQARECLLEKLQLQAREACGGRERELRDDPDVCLDLAQESAHLATTYRQLYDKMQTEGVFNYVPYSWVSLVHVKTEFYKALAHQYCATALLHATGAPPPARLATVYAPQDGHSDDTATPPLKLEQEADVAALGRAHLAEALALYEEALRLQRMCRELRGKEALSRAVLAQRERAARDRAALHDEPDFAELLDAPHILPSSKFQLALTPPDFAQHRVEDLFRSLGPIAVFSAKRHWSAPRLVQLQKHARERARQERSDLKRRTSDKRDRSEDNSTYYGRIIRSDEKYCSEYDRVTKQNGVYISGFENNYDYHPKVLDYEKYEYRKDYADGYRDKEGKKGREIRKENGRESGRDHRRENGKENGRDSGREARRENGKEAARENGREVWRENGKEVGRENGREVWKENGRDSGREVRKENGREGRESGREVRRENGRENGRERRKCELRRAASEYSVANMMEDEGFGFSVRGDSPVVIAAVEPNSLADIGGMREGDFIMSIGDRDAKWSSHEEVVRLIQAAGDCLTLRLATPMDKSCSKASPEASRQSGSGSLSAASTSSGSTPRSAARRAPSWNPFRRHAPRPHPHQHQHTPHPPPLHNVLFR